jgi:hypothetical protein
MNLTQETLECLVAQMGETVGSVLKCVIQQEIQAHMDRIVQLQNILETGVCVPPAEIPTTQ